MSAPPRTAEQRNILLGIAFVCIAGTMFPFMNAFSKTLAQTYPIPQVSWARFFGHVVFLAILFMPTRGWRLLITRRPKIQLTRSVIQFVSNLSFTAGIAYQPVADAAAISMTGPLIVAMLAWPMLGERTGVVQACAIMLGFVGVLFVVRPGGDVFHPSALFILGSALCYALYQIFTRMVANTDPPETTTFYSSLFGAIGMLVILPFIWVTPVSVRDVIYFCSLGVLGGAGHYLIVRALAWAPANIISPFQYFQLIGSVTVGYLMFSQLPDAMTWLGASIIVAAGLLLGYSQTRRR